MRTIDASEIELLARIGPIDRELVRSRLPRGDTCYGGRPRRASPDLSVPDGGVGAWASQLSGRAEPCGSDRPAVVPGDLDRDTTRDNAASQQGILRPGFQMIGQLDALAIGPLTIPPSSRSSLARMIGE